ncbi:hypothetical protein BYT27DRAFT_7240674 [Phlegmacium glaucopus]|nr:hypothetical protein BYT27DRAFT_7240674 [Phlegmacium glaucopus]
MSAGSAPPFPSMSAPAAKHKVALPPLELTGVEMEDAWRVQKSQINCWFENHCHKSSIATRLSLTRNISLRQVVCHIYKAEIQTIAAKRADGAKPGSQRYIQGFQGAVNEFMEQLEPEKLMELEQVRVEWRTRGQPSEVQRKTVERNGHSFLESHDFNENLGKVKVQPFEVKFPEAVKQFEGYWVQYMRYCYHVELGEEVDLVAQSRATTILIPLNRDVKGFPLVPPPQEGDTLVYMKQIIRSFITMHYRFASGHEHDRVPWKRIKENMADFIDPKYLPENTVIDDPSDMKKEHIMQLLNHWRRPVSGADLFRLSHVLVNTKTDQLTPALYKHSPTSTPTRLDGPINGEPVDGEPINGGPINGEPIEGRLTSEWDAEYIPLDPDGDVNMDPGLNHGDSTPVAFSPQLPPPATPVIDPQLFLEESLQASVIMKEGEGRPTSTPGPPPASADQEWPRPRPHPKQKKTTAVPLADPDPQPQAELGRSKRIAKRKLDPYTAEELKAAERAVQKEQAKRQKRGP